MKKIPDLLIIPIILLASVGIFVASIGITEAAGPVEYSQVARDYQMMAISKKPSNPCATKNPCGTNPCAMQNPCATKNPCAVKKSLWSQSVRREEPLRSEPVRR